jgi:hypothetical protein
MHARVNSFARPLALYTIMGLDFRNRTQPDGNVIHRFPLSLGERSHLRKGRALD